MFPHHQARLQHHLGILQINSILKLSIWREDQTPQVKSSVLENCPPPSHFRYQFKDQVVPCASDPPTYRSKVTTTISLDSINLLEGFTEFREIFYLPDYQFETNRYNSAARWKRCIGQGMGKGHKAQMINCPFA